uniref:Uncharacterized protein n=1 Tax=Tanacetum cinerariifolium TaxID=118510 RepID=A0A699HNG0_TANCI|nr:hypothetical protein [Tanacetum cinerariifolium]
MRRFGKGFSRVDPSLFDGMLVPQQVHNDVVNDVADDVESTPPSSPHQSPIAQPSSPPPQQSHSHDAEISMALLNKLLETCATLTKKVGNLEQDKIAQAIEITKLKQRLTLLWMIRRMHPNRGGIAKLDVDEDVTLEDVDAKNDTEVQGRLEESQVQASAPRRRRGVIIQDPEEAATASLSMQSEQAAKKQKIDEEVEEIKTHLQIVPHEEDDVADGTHQLFLSFISMLRNFDREDLEMPWKIIQERFASSKPKNFSDDFLPNAFKTMFEKLNVEANIWKNQRGRYGLAKVKNWKLLESCGVHIITFITTQMILLVERRYPFTRFTLDQMLNNVRLEVKEESEVSLELLRFVRRQQQEGYKPE